MKGTAVISRSDAGARAGLAAAALICLAAAAGCASSPSSPAAPASPASTSATPAAPGASSSAAAAATPPPASPAVAPGCATSSLQLKQGPAEGYAGGTDEEIEFTNTSGAACTLYGFPGVSLVSAPPYTQIGLAAKRGTSSPVRLVTLGPGATASATLQIVDAMNYPPATCSPVKAAYLRVYPPNQTVPAYLPNTSYACAEPVQTMVISAVQAGSGGSS